MIEGPEDARFRAFRKAKEEEPEMDYDEPEDLWDEEYDVVSDDDTL